MNTQRTIKLGYNSLGQYFIHIYCADGSACSEGPFKSGEEAMAAMEVFESGSRWDLYAELYDF